MSSKELLKKLSEGEIGLEDFAPTLILIKTEDEVIPEDAKLSKELIEFLIKTSGDGLPSVLVFYNNGEITL
jgi:hypothetical protein